MADTDTCVGVIKYQMKYVVVVQVVRLTLEY
jgi:hypothetical protein